MNNITEVVFILDASGSMYCLTDDTIGGFNSLLSKQKKEEGEALITTVLFNDTNKILHDRLNISDVPDMTDKDYVANGSTALIDAMGDTITHIEKIHRYIRKEDIPNKTLFVITTDGMENSSVKYSSDEIKKMVEKKKSEGWEFIFLGANIDAVETAGNYGIEKERAANYRNTSTGVRKLFACLDEGILNLRKGNVITEEWKINLENDDKDEAEKFL